MVERFLLPSIDSLDAGELRGSGFLLGFSSMRLKNILVEGLCRCNDTLMQSGSSENLILDFVAFTGVLVLGIFGREGKSLEGSCKKY